MANRVRSSTMAHGGRYERPWVVYVDGELLRDGRGGARRFKTEFAARDAGVRNQVQRDRLNAALARGGEESAHVVGSEEQEGVRFTSWCDTHSRATPCDKCAALDTQAQPSLTTDQKYWLDRRADIIAALAAEGLQIWSDKDRVWLHRAAPASPKEPK